jgi:hypothetical protein
MRRASCLDVVFLVLLFLYVWIAQKNSDSGFLVYRRYVSVWFAVRIGNSSSRRSSLELEEGRVWLFLSKEWINQSKSNRRSTEMEIRDRWALGRDGGTRFNR